MDKQNYSESMLIAPLDNTLRINTDVDEWNMKVYIDSNPVTPKQLRKAMDLLTWFEVTLGLGGARCSK